MISESQQRAAKVAAVAYLLSFVTVVVMNFAVEGPLIVSGNAVATAENILAHTTQFRAGIVGEVFYCAFIVVVSAALYIVLEPAGRGVALMATLSRLVWAVIWIMKTLSYFQALRLLHNKVLPPQIAQELARISIGTGFEQYYVGLLFAGLAPTLCAYLLWKAEYVPHWLAGFGIVASAWSVICTVVFLIVPEFGSAVNPWLFDIGLALYEFVLSIWLLVKGVRGATEERMPVF